MTDPRGDKARIESSKDLLLRDSYIWILDNKDFIDWRDDDETRLLWIKGDPGKGKTMLLIGIIEELSRKLKSSPGSNVLSYFFCQGTDSRLNHATAVLRGLVYLMLIQQRILVSHLREKFNHAGGQLFEDANAFYALSEIFRDMLHDPRLTKVYLIIDALDECESGLLRLLDLIVRNASTSSRVKWLVSSRNRPDIEEWLRLDNNHAKLSLELNAQYISSAVDAYIDHKLLELTQLKQYDSTLQDQVKDQLHQKANGTFLWVALVCKELQEVESWNVLEVLYEIPSNLTPLYDRMIGQIRRLKRKDPELCKLILSATCLAYRPLHLQELAALSRLPEQVSRTLQSIKKIVNMCGSFLTIREETVYFIHQSAKDYLSTKADHEIFSAGYVEVHREIVSRSVQIMSEALRRDVYGLGDPGASIDQIGSIDPDPLARVRYSCVYWVDHLCQMDSSSQSQVGLYNGGKIHIFLKNHFLHWLEALSLIRSMSNVIVMVSKLENLLRVSFSSHNAI